MNAELPANGMEKNYSVHIARRKRMRKSLENWSEKKMRKFLKFVEEHFPMELDNLLYCYKHKREYKYRRKE